MKSKKGISGVVTTLFIIVFAILAVVLLWTMVLKPLIERGGRQATLRQRCMEINLQIDSVDVENGEVTYSRGGGEANVNEVFVIADGNRTSQGPLDPLEGGTQTFNNLSDGSVIKIAAQIQDDQGNNYTCDVADTYTVK